MTYLLSQPISLVTIRQGSRNQAVYLWQAFLADFGLLNDEPDGVFGRQTSQATKTYQRQKGLKDDGIVGRKTYALALLDGFAEPLETIGLSLLNRYDRNEAVERWQQFLVGQERLFSGVSGEFDIATQQATEHYQQDKGLIITGRVERDTYSQAFLDGFSFNPTNSVDSDLPPKPDFASMNNTRDRERLFGKFEYSKTPTKDNPEKITVHGNWPSQNIQRVVIPQIKHVHKSGVMDFHRLAVPQLQALWKAWEDQELLDLVLTYHGSYNARFVRGKIGTLSNHAFGTAFDINYQWNKLGHEPAPRGSYGSVIELVPIANDFGFYWGGHYNKRPDGMHFEVAKLMDKNELDQAVRKYARDAQPVDSKSKGDEPSEEPGSMWDWLF